MRNKRAKNSKAIRDAFTLNRCKETLAEFDSKFPDEQSQLTEILRIIKIHAKCRFCKGDVNSSKTEPRMYNCRRCHKRGSYTTETIFCRVKQLRPWLVAILFFEEGIPVNPSQFSRLLGIAYSTAHVMFLKVAYLVSREQERLSDTVEADTVKFRGAFGKRSRLTPANSMPANEPYLDESKLTEFERKEPLTTADLVLRASLADLAKENPLAKDIFEFIKERGQPNKSNVMETFSRTRLSETGSDTKDLALVFLLGEMEEKQIIMKAGQFRYAVYDRYFVDPNLPCICRQKKKQRKYCPYHCQRYDMARLKRTDLAKVDQRSNLVSFRAIGKASVNEGKYIDFMSAYQWKISRKYSQLYLALMWWFIDAKHEKTKELLFLCATEKMPEAGYLRWYNTPEQVLIRNAQLARCA